MTKQMKMAPNRTTAHPRKRQSLKIRTMFSVIIGSSILGLSSLEYKYIKMNVPLAIPSSSSSSSSSLKASISRGLRLENPEPKRYGFVQRDALRTDTLHETEVFMKFSQPTLNKEVKSHPRVVFLRDDPSEDNKWSVINSTVILSDPNHFINEMEWSIGSSVEPDYFIKDFERPFTEECEPIIKPQVHSNCNSLHELAIESDITLLTTSGSWRTTWKVDSSEVALKMLNYNRNFDLQSMQAHATDAMVMDRLSSSPYTVNAYGFCSESVMTEFAPMGGRDHVKSYDIRPGTRLKIARDLARGLADLQSLRHLHTYADRNRTAVFAHNDINIANTVFVGGKVKWNDFNIGVLLRTEKQNKEKLCGSPVLFKGDLWRSPEEIRNASYVQVEQSDMYGFGNVLYQVMSRHQPWTHKEPEGKLTVEAVAARKQEGRLPTIPEQYKNTTKPELMTLYAATIACFHPIPEKRPTPFELAYGLEFIYELLKNKQKHMVTRKMIGKFFLQK